MKLFTRTVRANNFAKIMIHSIANDSNQEFEYVTEKMWEEWALTILERQQNEF